MNTKDGARDYVGIRKGLGGQSLGELEAQILDIIWDLEPPVTSTQVFKIMYPRKELSYSTVMLTMAKLSRKGILTQDRMGDKKTDPFVYTPNFSREEMAVRLMDDVSRKLLRKPLAEAVPTLCGTAVAIGEKDLAELAKLVTAATQKGVSG